MNLKKMSRTSTVDPVPTPVPWSRPNRVFECFSKILMSLRAVLDELRSEDPSGMLPFLSISGEDGVAEKIVPVFIELLALAVVVELGCEDGFDVDFVHCKDDALGACACKQTI